MYINTFAVLVGLFLYYRFISYSDFRDIKYCLEEMTEHICLGGRESKSMQVFPEINPKDPPRCASGSHNLGSHER